MSAPVGNTALRIVLADDVPEIRSLLRRCFELDPTVTVVGEAADGAYAVGVVCRTQADVILLDLAMPGMGGLEALPLLLAVVPSARVVVLSSLEPAYLMEKAGGQGAAAFCTKIDAPDTLLGALGPPVAA